jgi:endoglucanase
MIGLALALTVAASCGRSTEWPLYQRYVDAFVTQDGRVREPSAGDRTTSEGQAYALLLALVANDRPLYERLLGWTRNNLAGGDLGRGLPGWHWGKDERGAWRLLDRSSAADADLWLAYALLEAGRLWCQPAFTALGRQVVGQVVARELPRLPGLGPMLLPGPVGFELKKGRLWRLNPSYLPLQLLRRFARDDLPGPWSELAATTVRMIRASAARGFVPDWVAYDRERGFTADPVAGPVGSYDAIRVYLWAGMLPPEEQLRPLLLAALDGPGRWFRDRGSLPERLELPALRERGQAAPPGFYAVLLPEARSRGDDQLAARLGAALAGVLKDGLYGDPPTYFDQNLILFGRGFAEGRFAFEASGALRPDWEGPCCER